MDAAGRLVGHYTAAELLAPAAFGTNPLQVRTRLAPARIILPTALVNPIRARGLKSDSRFPSPVQPLYALNLQLLADVHLVRNWRVVTRYVNQADPAAPLVQARKLRFEAPDRLVLH
ncbi:MAG: hypothetical protein H7330_09720 [Hymenobacteraceae bacterium]|nr:hypothetical protein [Hymenobacteraceae bacterium]